MHTFKTITDKDFGLSIKKMSNPRVRFGSRGIIVNNKGEVALLYKKNINEYKLIGGGVEENENFEDAFKREALEETGCLIEIKEYIGNIKEIKTHDNFIQVSHIFLAYVVKNGSKLNLTEKEINEGSVCIWVKTEDAIELVNGSLDKIIASEYEDKMSIYHSKFIVRRDATILKFYNNNLQNKFHVEF